MASAASSLRPGHGISVAIAGPANPADLADLLDPVHREVATSMAGLGGRPVNNLVRALVDLGVSVDLVTLSPDVGFAELSGGGLRILVGNYRSRHRARDFFRAERQQVRLMLDASEAKVIHAHWTYEFALGALETKSRGILVQAHDAPFTILRRALDPYRIVRTAMAAAVRARSCRLLCVSPYLASRWRREMLFRGPIGILPNVVPTAPVRVEEVSPRRGPIILDVSDAGSNKNVSALIRAMTYVLDKFPAARCRLVGPGLDTASGLAREASALRVRDAIDFVGAVPPEAVSDEYRKACVFAHPSLEESFGMSAAEAMSHSLPVVAGKKSGALPWLLAGGKAGALVDVRQPAEIASAICRILADENLQRVLGGSARERVRVEFGPEKIASRAMGLYEQVEALT
jgi:glycosyltransferase involved in cell wall biosynthesis